MFKYGIPRILKPTSQYSGDSKANASVPSLVIDFLGSYPGFSVSALTCVSDIFVGLPGLLICVSDSMLQKVPELLVLVTSYVGIIMDDDLED